MEKKLSKLQKDLLGIIYEEYKSNKRAEKVFNKAIDISYDPQRWFYYYLHGLTYQQLLYIEKIAGIDSAHGDIYLNKYIRRAVRESNSWFADIPLYTPAVAASFSRAIKRLEERGLIVRYSYKDGYRENKKKSRRNNMIKLTEKGYVEVWQQEKKKEQEPPAIES